MQVNLNSTFAELSALDKVAIYAPHWLYSCGAKPEVITFGVMIIIATTLVVVGSYATVSQPSLASDPVDDKNCLLWDPTDRDGSSLYIMLPDSALNLNADLIDYKSALMLPILAAGALFGLDYLLRRFDIGKIKMLKVYLTAMVIPTTFLTLNYLLTVFLRNVGFALGLKDNLGYFFNRYRLTLSSDNKSPLGVIEQFDLMRMNMTKAELNDFRRFMLERNNVKMIKLHAVKAKKQYFAIVWDAKFLFTLPISISCLVMYNLYSSESYRVNNINWIVNNLVASTFAISGCMFTRVGSFKVATLMLVALFAYDIYFVFGSTLMVTVATNIDLPVKIVMPTIPVELFSWSDIWTKQLQEIRGGASILGLGDIVVPAAFISLCLRFDYFLYYSRTNLAFHYLRCIGIPKYFILAVLAYISALCVTVTVNYYTKHGQPALLYIVPMLLISVFSHAAWRNEFSQLWKFTEEFEAFTEDADVGSTVGSELQENSVIVSEEPSFQVVKDRIMYQFQFSNEELDETYIVDEQMEDDLDSFDEDLSEEIKNLLREQEDYKELKE